jgi:hypothetical protein
MLVTSGNLNSDSSERILILPYILQKEHQNTRQGGNPAMFFLLPVQELHHTQIKSIV